MYTHACIKDRTHKCFPLTVSMMCGTNPFTTCMRAMFCRELASRGNTDNTLQQLNYHQTVPLYIILPSFVTMADEMNRANLNETFLDRKYVVNGTGLFWCVGRLCLCNIIVSVCISISYRKRERQVQDTVTL